MRLPLIALAVSLGALTLAGDASAHAHLATATPQPNGTLASAPAQVDIEFTEELEPKLSAIKVEDANGNTVDAGDSHLDANDGKHLVVSLKAVPAGTYKVVWDVTATDAHKTHGAYTFRVTG